MTEISFYHLTKTPFEKALPRLLDKVLSSGNKAVLMAESDEKLKQIDNFLWTFSTKIFLPHGTSEDGFSADQPIFLTLQEENPNEANMLVTVEGVEPSYLKDFGRVLDVFDGNSEDEVSQARARWKKYKEEGHTLTYWQQDDKGNWQEAA